MDIRIIKGNTANLPFIAQLEKKCFNEIQQSNLRCLRLSLNSKFQSVYIAQVKTKSRWENAGAVVLHIHKKTLRVYSIAVLEEYRLIRIGKRLMEYCIQFAETQGYEKISLEALSSNNALISWYQAFGFAVNETLPNYYASGFDAVRMSVKVKNEKHIPAIENLIVMDRPKLFSINIPDTEVISGRQYINSNKYKTMKNVRVFNLCDSYKYQTEGYYVSLLASAREHRVFPSVTTIGDYKNITFIKSISSELDDLIQKTLASETEKKASLNIYFGQTPTEKYKVLASKLYNIFESPLIQIEFAKGKNWQINRITPLIYSKLSEDDRSQLQEYIEKFFSRKRFHRPRLKNYKYDLAILVNPEEKNSPSCPRALERFKAAADKCGFYTEFITKDDINRISEFDALFIRETTSVNNHTYMIARLAYAEGLVVIDDPWSILRCSNKIFLHERMVLNKIPVPYSKILSKSCFKPSDVSDMSFPLVLKQPDGSFSVGVSKVNNVGELEESLKKLFKSSELIIAQSFIPSDFDWRIGLIDQKPLYACKYYMAPGHWQIYNWKRDDDDRLGISQAVPIEEIPPKVLDTAMKAASLMGDGLYGVDLKEINGEVYIIEVNDNPNIDYKIEDLILKDELYMRIIRSIYNRIEMSRNVSRFVAADPIPIMPARQIPVTHPEMNTRQSAEAYRQELLEQEMLAE